MLYVLNSSVFSVTYTQGRPQERHRGTGQFPYRFVEINVCKFHRRLCHICRGKVSKSLPTPCLWLSSHFTLHYGVYIASPSNLRIVITYKSTVIVLQRKSYDSRISCFQTLKNPTKTMKVKKWLYKRNIKIRWQRELLKLWRVLKCSEISTCYLTFHLDVSFCKIPRPTSVMNIVRLSAFLRY